MKNPCNDPEQTSPDNLRNMFLPVKDDDSKFVKGFKNSMFYFAAVMMLLSTLMVFAAVLIAA
jgi:hypothetical protein